MDRDIALAQMMFLYHFDQMVANMQVMRDRPMRHEAKQSFNRMLRTVNAHINRFEAAMGDSEVAQQFQHNASLLGDVLREFMKSDDPEGMLNKIKEG